MKLKMIVLCRNASGDPTFHTCVVEATEQEYDLGEHYDKAVKDAESNGYESPFEVFDENDEAAKQMVDLGTWISDKARPFEKQPIHYLLIMVGDVEPELCGPYDNEDAVLQAARHNRMDDPEMENGLFRLTVYNGRPDVSAFAGADFEVDDEIAP